MSNARARALDAGRQEHARQLRERRPARQASPRRAYEQLRSSIRVGSVGPDELLAELRLGEQLGVSRNSVRAALQLLAEEGLVVRRTKTGTRTSQRSIVEIPVGEVLPRDFDDRARYPEITVHHLGYEVVRSPEAVRVPLSMPDRPTLVIEQLSVWHGEPLYIRTGYIPLHEPPEDLLARVSSLDADLRSFAESFRYLFGRAPGRRRAAVEAVPATSDTAGLLELPVGRPILLRQLVMHDDEGAVREVSFTHFRGDRVALASGSC